VWSSFFSRVASLLHNQRPQQGRKKNNKERDVPKNSYVPFLAHDHISSSLTQRFFFCLGRILSHCVNIELTTDRRRRQQEKKKKTPTVITSAERKSSKAEKEDQKKPKPHEYNTRGREEKRKKQLH